MRSCDMTDPDTAPPLNRHGWSAILILVILGFVALPFVVFAWAKLSDWGLMGAWALGAGA